MGGFFFGWVASGCCGVGWGFRRGVGGWGVVSVLDSFLVGVLGCCCVVDGV